jgi:FAD/FMN-containing dehydrogenase
MKTVSIASRNGKQRMLAYAVVQPFRNGLKGEVLLPGDEGYDAARHIWNGMIDKHPAMIVQCACPADVAQAVNLARDEGLLLSIRGGGHNVAGGSVADKGLMLDLTRMRDVQVDPDRRVARAQGGAKLADLDAATSPFALAAPVGVVSATGVAGLTLHGGAGWLMRRHGLSVDNLLAVEMVTADGRVRRASADENPDLFWAVRGGGGNFGVVTAFELALHPVGPEVWMAAPIYPLERAPEVIAAARDYLARASDDLMALAVLWSGPETPEVPQEWQGAPVVVLLGCYTGPVEEGERAIAPLREIGRPIADLSARMPWVEAQKFLDPDYPDGRLYYWKSLYFDRLDAEVIDLLARQTESRPSPLSSIDIWLLGGAVSRVEPTATPFWNRSAPYMLGIEANWERGEDSDANVAWARGLFDAMQPYSDGGVYLNFPGFHEEGDAMVKAAYGPNAARLREIKAAHDPDGIFPGLLSRTG